MKTQGQIEALVGEVVNRFLQQAVGRGASNVLVAFRSNAIFIHLRDVLTVGEHSLVAADGTGDDRGRRAVREGRDLLLRHHRDALESALAAACGCRTAALFHDIDPTTGDALIAATFSPATGHERPASQRRDPTGL